MSAAAAASASKIVLVTGANKGIGFETVKLLAAQHPQWTILLGSRSQANADAALKKLSAEAQKIVHALVIDVDSDESITAAAAQVKAKYGKLDVLFDNAAIARWEANHANAVDTLRTNVFGLQKVDAAFLPLIPSGGRIVIVSSEVGSWTHFAAPAALQKQLEATETLQWSEIAKLAQQYVDSTQAGSKDAALFPDPKPFGAYGASKMFLSAYGRVQARDLRAKNIAVMLVSPGYCATDLNNHSGPRSAEMGGKSLLMALERPISEAGKLFLDNDDQGVSAEVPAFVLEGLAKAAAAHASPAPAK